MRTPVLTGLLLPALVFSGCVDCGRCVFNLLEVEVSAAGDASEVTITGIESSFCTREMSASDWRCTAYSTPPGDYTVRVSSPGFEDATLDVTLEEQVVSGCECPETLWRSVMLTRTGTGAGDAGTVLDGG
ncbi:MAG: PEGA domain-containing protein [Sandaracinaceae bacterium]